MDDRTDANTRPLWSEPAAWPAEIRTPPAQPTSNLDGLMADVIVVGAGITGLTAAAELKRSGRRVLVLDAGQVAGGESQRTTAHLTEVLDTRFATLIRRFGTKGARLILEGQRHAIAWIESQVREFHIQCSFQRLPGYLYADGGDRAQESALQQEASAASELGYGTLRTTEVPLPFRVTGALRFENQAQFNPGPYLAALASRVDGHGSLIVTGVRVLSVDEDDDARCRVSTDRGEAFAHHVIVAAHVPSNNRWFIHNKLSPRRSYVVAAPVTRPLPGLFWDLGDPYHYLRTAEIGGVHYLLAGGEDHRVGESVDTEHVFRRLARFVRARFGHVDLSHHWSGQIIETADGLPYIGRNSQENRIFVATGLSGNGYTNGTLAGLLLADTIRGRENRWSKTFAATRSPPIGALPEYLSENLKAAKHMVLDRFKSDGETLTELARNDGMVLERAGKKLAVYRDPAGTLHTLSAVCPHMGGQVQWNGVEKSWDCPCHGSRFDCEGHVINGPAVDDLSRRSLEDGDQDRGPDSDRHGDDSPGAVPAVFVG